MPKEKYMTKHLLFAIIIHYYLLNTLISPEVMISQSNMILFKITGKKIYFCFSLFKQIPDSSFKITGFREAWLAQSAEHATLDLGVISSNSKRGVQIT